MNFHDAFPFVIVIVVFVGILLLVTLVQRAERQRVESLRQWAARYGYQFQPQRRSGLDRYYPPFDCLQKGSRRVGYNIILGNYAERPFCAFDYLYVTYSTDSKGNKTKQTHRLSCVVIELPWAVQSLAIRREHFLDRMADFFGAGDIEFELDEFNRAFHVRSPNQQWAFDVLHQDAMEFLLRSAAFSLEFGGHWLLLRSEDSLRREMHTPKDIENALMLGAGLLRRFPPYLVQLLEGKGAS